MNSMAVAETHLAPSALAPRVAACQNALLWLVGFGGAIVFIEPSPYELATLVALIFFVLTGLSLRLALLPLILLLFLINIGYTISAAHLLNLPRIVNWILTSWYLAITAIFFSMVISENTEERLRYLSRGMIFGAVIAAFAGVAGYFGLASRSLFTLYGRASGTFKDPNVLGAYLILPSLFAIQSVVLDDFRKAFRNALVVGLFAVAILLAFSRAAWGQFVLTSLFMLVLMVLTSDSRAQRNRIILTSIIAVFACAFLLTILLSLDAVQELFRQRASFDQSYDGGRFGRFGRHILGAQMALELPLGIGPLQFTKFFPEDTHNSYLNAFMSGGWLTGICYPVMILITTVFGFRHVFVRVPWQRAYLAIFASFLGTVAEAAIIDTDHWRHFWLTLGAMWGMFIAARHYCARQHLPK